MITSFCPIRLEGFLIKMKKKTSTSRPFLILLWWFPTIHRLQRISHPPLTPHWDADITICDYLIILWCSILALQCLCCKWKSCQSLLEMKVLRFPTHLLSLPQSKPSFHGAVANEGAIRLSPRRHYRVFIWVCLKFQPLVIWTLFHVHHQKDIKQNAAFKIRSQSLGQIAVCVCVCACICVRVQNACNLCIYPARKCKVFFSIWIILNFSPKLERVWCLQNQNLTRSTEVLLEKYIITTLLWKWKGVPTDNVFIPGSKSFL